MVCYSKMVHKTQQILPWAGIEPHAKILRIPPDDQLLFKIVNIEDLLRSIMKNYLHFTRVDSYSDFPNADENDGRQLPKDKPVNNAAKFQKSPDFSAADYYDQSRSRTYASCFSIKNSPYIWEKYATENETGKACVVFEFGKLRSMLNSTLNSKNATLLYGNDHCHQIFSVNYGLVNYVPWETHRTNEQYFSNPIVYTFLKDNKRFREEREFRISLSALGIGNFALNNGSIFEFPEALQLGFNFRNAIASGAIKEILLAPDADSNSLKRDLAKLRIEFASSSE